MTLGAAQDFPLEIRKKKSRQKKVCESVISCGQVHLQQLFHVFRSKRVGQNNKTTFKSNTTEVETREVDCSVELPKTGAAAGKVGGNIPLPRLFSTTTEKKQRGSTIALNPL